MTASRAGLAETVVETAALAMWEGTFPGPWATVLERWKTEFRRQVRITLRGARKGLEAAVRDNGRARTEVEHAALDVLLDVLA